MRLLGLVLTSHSAYNQNHSGIGVWRWCCPVLTCWSLSRIHYFTCWSENGLDFVLGPQHSTYIPNDLKTGPSANLQYQISWPWFETLELEPKHFSRLSNWQTTPSTRTDFHSPHAQSVNSFLYLISRKGLGCGNRGYCGNTKLPCHWPATKRRKKKLKTMTSLHQRGMIVFSYVQFTHADESWYHRSHHQPFQFAN